MKNALVLRVALATSFILVSSLVLHAAPPGENGLPTATAPQGWGINIHFTDPGPGEMARFSEAGFGFARTDFGWTRCERVQGQYDFSAYDRLYETLKKVGTRPLFILDYGNPLYQAGAPTTPEARAAFARFASAAVTHFKGKNIVWEIWNEPNGAQFWKPKPDAGQYADLAVEAARAIRAADPNVILIAPGTSGLPYEYFERVFQSGLLAYLDGVSCHPYRGSSPESAGESYARLRVLIARYAPKRKENLPIISSEWGYSTKTGGVSEAEQARYLTRMWLVNVASGVNLSIFYDWKNDGPDPKENEHRFGTVQQDLTPKPAFLAAKSLIASLKGYTFRHRLVGETPRDWKLLFQKGDGGDLALVSWTANPQAPEAEQTPVVENIAPTDTRYIGLRRLADVRFAPDVLTEQTGRNATLDIQILNTSEETARISLASHRGDVRGMKLSAEATLSPAKTRFTRINLPLTRTRERAAYDVPLELLWNGEKLPAIAPLTVRRVDALTLSMGVENVTARADTALSVTVENPSGLPFGGTLTVQGSKTGQTLKFPQALTERQRTTRIVITGDRGPFTALLTDEKGERIAFAGPINFAPFQPFPQKAGDTTDWRRVLSVENAPQAPEAVKAMTNLSGGQDVSAALAFPYTFAKGWQYVQLIPAAPMTIPAGAAALTFQLRGDNSGNYLRARFSDATGQIFQPDLGMLNSSEWRQVRIPLDGKAAGGHWGGANDGIPHPPLKWESLLLIDSAKRNDPASGELLIASPVYTVLAARPEATP